MISSSSSEDSKSNAEPGCSASPSPSPHPASCKKSGISSPESCAAMLMGAASSLERSAIQFGVSSGVESCESPGGSSWSSPSSKKEPKSPPLSAEDGDANHSGISSPLESPPSTSTPNEEAQAGCFSLSSTIWPGCQSRRSTVIACAGTASGTGISAVMRAV